MSQENVEAVQRGFEAWNDGEVGVLLALLDEDLVTRRHAPLPDPGTWHGREGFLEVIAGWTEGFDEFTQTAEEFVDAGEHVVVRVRHEGRGAISSAPVEATFWFTYSVREGKARTIDLYASKEQALEAVGLA